MMHKRAMYRAIAILLAVIICFPAFECSALAAQDGMIRVKLTRLGTRQSISFRTNCAYAIGGNTDRRIPSGANCTVTLSGGGLTLTVNGVQAAAGISLELRRGSSGGTNGVTFTSPSYSGVYPGDLLFSVSSGSIQTVLRAFIEDYVVGVVACEMGNSFPLEALKAQAIAARTYAMMVKKSSGSYDLVDNTSAQAFRGYNTGSNVVAAVNATRGMVAYYNGSMARLYYAASNGGQTELSGNVWTSNLPYLVQKDDPYDYENTASVKKSYTFQRDFSANSLPNSVKSAMLNAVAAEFTKNGLPTDGSGVIIESLDGMELHSPNYPAPSRTYTQVRVTVTARAGSSPSRSVSFDLATYGLLEGALGLGINSSNNETYEVTETASGFTLTARRFGHGVGMSQRGAQQMASKYGMPYRDILSFYFPGIEVRTLEFTDTTGHFSGGTAEEDGPEPTQPPVESTGVYAVVRLSDSSSRLNLRAQPGTSSSILGKLSHGARVEVLSVEGDWVRVHYAGAVGYVMKSYLRLEEGTTVPTPAPTAAGEGRWATLTLSSSSGRMHLRQGPSTSTPSLTILSHGDRVEVLGASGEWSNIRANGMVGYVKTQYLVFGAPPQESGEGEDLPLFGGSEGEESGVYATVRLNSSSSQLNVRASASTSARVIARLSQGFRVEVLGASGGWVKIRALGVEGYVSQAYLALEGEESGGGEAEDGDVPWFGGELSEPSPTPGESGVEMLFYAVVVLQEPDSTLSLRESASSAAARVGRLPNGAVIEVLEYRGDWARVRWQGQTGFASREYLERPRYTAVALEDLAVYAQPAFGMEAMGRLEAGVRVAVNEARDGWAQVFYKGEWGYALMAGLEPD